MADTTTTATNEDELVDYDEENEQEEKVRGCGEREGGREGREGARLPLKITRGHERQRIASKREQGNGGTGVVKKGWSFFG